MDTHLKKSAFALCSAVLFLAGCAAPRGNHFYSQSNATQVSGAESTYEGVVSTNSGITAKFIDAIGQDGNLIQLANSQREQLHESSFVDSIENKTWAGLRQGIWKELGSSEGDKSVIDANIAQRTNMVQAIATILSTLSQGQAALAQNAAKQASNSLTVLTNSTNSATTNGKQSPVAVNSVNTNQATVAVALEFLQSALITAGRETATNALIQSNATSLEKLIFTQADQSRDPASAYALVALVNSGLGSNDFLLLGTYLTNLQIALSNQLVTTKQTNNTGKPLTANAVIAPLSSQVPKKQTAGAAPGAPSVQETDTAQPEESAENEVKRFVIYSILPKRNSSVRRGGAPSAAEPLTGYELKFANSYSQAFQLLARLPGSAIKESAMTSAGDADAAAVPARSATEPTPASAPPDNTTPNPGINLESIVVDLPTVVNDLASLAKDVNVNLSGVQKVLNDGNAISNLMIAFTSGGAVGTNALAALVNLGTLDPTVGKFFNQDLPLTNITQKVFDIVTDINSEKAAATSRLLSYFAQLAQTQASLYEENARHYTVLGAIAAREIQRWAWIEDVYNRNARLYMPFTGQDWTPVFQDNWPLPRTNVLFLSSTTIKAFPSFYNVDFHGTTLTNAPTNALDLPDIQENDRILPSLQLLAEAAKNLQKGSPGSMDPLGLRHELAQARLNQGIEVLLDSDFLINYNIRQADSLNVMLVNEMKEHSVTLDGLELQPAEANIRLQLADSVAFHSTGITDADIQWIVSTLGAGPVGYIAAKVK